MNEPNSIRQSQTVRGEQAYIYCLKARAKRHHCLGYGTFSVDLDSLERRRKEYSRLVRPITYVPLYLKATALAIQRSPEANGILFRKPFGLRIVQFEKIDVNLPITRRVGDRTVTFIGTVRDAAAKPLHEIQEELIRYQKDPPEDSFAMSRFQRLSEMPLWKLQWIHWRMTRSPRFLIRNAGTCGVTFIEGDGADHMFPIAPTSVVFGIGGARCEPVARGGTSAVGRVLKCTLMVDNYVVSGLAGARLGKDFKDILESGCLIAEELQRTGEVA
jgi:pyruvate/2-oxoglutarate dehydrogenase complex dihydrolipoamide acyltransferase (E2) component